MPLSPSEVAYINREMDRYLARQRAWPFLRYIALLSGLALVLFGLWLSQTAPLLDRNTEAPSLVPRSQRSGAATEPVTQSQLLSVLRASDYTAREEAQRAAKISSYLLICLTSALINLFLGSYLIAHTLTRWKRHRRDMILITLLREKCREELSMDELAR